MRSKRESGRIHMFFIAINTRNDARDSRTDSEIPTLHLAVYKMSNAL